MKRALILSLLVSVNCEAFAQINSGSEVTVRLSNSDRELLKEVAERLEDLDAQQTSETIYRMNERENYDALNSPMPGSRNVVPIS